jgi:hypothetical protein
VQRINGRATQEYIQLKLEPYFHEFGEKPVTGGEALPKLAPGQTYEFEGFETGHFVGVPKEAYQRAGLMLQVPVGHGFTHRFTVYKGKRIDPIRWSPAEFVGREALIEGRAVSRDRKAYIVGADWRLLVDANAPWPKGSEGRTVEGLGTIRKSDTASTYRLENGVTRLVKLEDQLGREVSLRGRAWSMNGYWWFDYRGTVLYVEGMKDLPGWNVYLHGDPVLITGALDEAMLPALDQITLKSDRDRKKYFIVRKPSWKPIDNLLAPERVDR